MKFADVLLEDNPRALANPGMYCRADQPFAPEDKSGIWALKRAGRYDFTTYFNALSVSKLLEYTIATGFRLHVELRGAACEIQQTTVDALASTPTPVEANTESLPASDQWQIVDMPLTVGKGAVLVGFTITTQGRTEIRNSWYGAECPSPLRDVELMLSTTTFKKEHYVISNIDLVRRHILQSADDIARHFHMVVVDNGRTLDAQSLSGDGVEVIANDNVGGAGGFARGMLAALDQIPKATNVLLMDDDVAVSPESIKRTYNLLRIVKDEYREAMISGAMLNYEIPDMQSEDIGFVDPEGLCHACKPPLRLTKFEDIVYNEVFKPYSWMRKTMYAAWWYCCIPLTVIERDGLPLPLFVRCDDVEYGNRCKTRFISMNGLCVWHMPFEKRYSAAVERYQMTRNCLIAQASSDMAPNVDFIRKLREDVHLELKKFDYADAQLCLDAFEDFLKGPEFIGAKGRATERFMAANRNKERLVDLDELQRLTGQDPDLADFDITGLDRQLIDGDKPRTLSQRLFDLFTDNGQHLFRTQGDGYVVIPAAGWVYPAGVLHGKRKLVAVDWANRKGVIRIKDTGLYKAITKRLQDDLRAYQKTGKQTRAAYREAFPELTGEGAWRRALGMPTAQDN
jgi:hypothetical protein